VADKGAFPFPPIDKKGKKKLRQFRRGVVMLDQKQSGGLFTSGEHRNSMSGGKERATEKKRVPSSVA